MTTLKIAAIVEGHGDRYAIPQLIRRWLSLNEVFAPCDIRPFRTPGVSALLVPHDQSRGRGIEYFVGKASKLRPACILVVVDADDECERPTYRPHGEPLGPWLQRRCQTVVRNIPLRVVVADRCFESWFLLPPSQDALFDAGLFVARDPDVGSARGRIKQRLRCLMGRAYSESVDQPRLARKMPIGDEMEVSPSFRKLRKELAWLAQIVSRAGSPT